MEIFDRMGSGLVSQSLNAQSLRQRVIAENIANLNTPGYTAKRVRFEELLEQKSSMGRLRSTDQRHMQSGTGSAATAEVEDTERPVDLDEEMGTLAKVQLFYGIEAQNLSNRYRMLKQAISGTTT